MQKLLLVLAIQFCLPACSALLARLSPWAEAWNLEIYTVLLNTAFFGFSLALLPKRWTWIVGMIALLAAYAAVWLPAFLRKNSLHAHGWANFEYLGCTAAGVLLVGGILFQDYALVCELPAEQWGAEAPHWQFQLRDLLGATVLVAIAALGVMAYYRNNRQLVPEEHLILSGGDYFYAALGLPIFYLVLRPLLNWRKLGYFGLGLLGIVLLTLPLNLLYLHYQEDHPPLRFLDHLFFLVSLLLLALGSALLCRWAGLRIVDYKTRNFWAFARPGK